MRKQKKTPEKKPKVQDIVLGHIKLTDGRPAYTLSYKIQGEIKDPFFIETDKLETLKQYHKTLSKLGRGLLNFKIMAELQP